MRFIPPILPTPVILCHTVFMPRRVNPIHRIISHITVAIERLRIVCTRHHRIRAHKPPQRRIIIPRAIIHQPRARISPLPRKSKIRRHRSRRAAGIPKRIVILRTHTCAACRARRAKMVAVQIKYARARSHGDALFAKACPEASKDNNTCRLHHS